MGWRERDYSDTLWQKREAGAGGLGLPPRGSLALLILHIAAFAMVMTVRPWPGTATSTALALSATHADFLGIIAHPFASESLWVLVLTGLAIWMLAWRVEERFGAARLLVLYAAGNLAAGVAFFGLAHSVPTIAQVPLDSPIGAISAWSVVLYRDLSDVIVVVFGQLRRLSTVVAIVTAGVALLLFVFSGPSVLAWLAAMAAGGLAAPLVERIPQEPRWSVPREPAYEPQRREEPPPRASRPARQPRPADEPDIDAILAKISREGLGTLTTEEREQLEAARQAKLRERARTK